MGCINACMLECNAFHSCFEPNGVDSIIWHKIADGDLPKEEGDYLFYLYDKDTQNFIL